MIDDQSINFAVTNGDTLDQKGLASCPACLGNPCGDHGTCVAGADEKVTCKCNENYSGKFCDIAKGKHFNCLFLLFINNHL